MSYLQHPSWERAHFSKGIASNHCCVVALILPIVFICLLNFSILVAKTALHIRFFNILSLNWVIKLLARWHIQTLWYAYGSDQPSWTSFISTIMPKCRYDITQSPLLWVTLVLMHAKNHPQLSILSPSVRTKANENNWLFPPQTIAIIKVFLYFPYKRVPSILSTSRQCLKPSIDRWNVKKKLTKISLYSP